MHISHGADLADDRAIAIVQYCPRCDVPRVMSLESIQPALFGNRSTISYRCETCATRRVDVVSSHALGHVREAGWFHRRLTDGRAPVAAL